MRKLFYKILPILLAVVIFTGCTKLEDFGSTNDNPAVTPNPSTAALLTNTLSRVGGYVTNINGSRPGLYCQYFSETQYTDVSLYSLPKLSSTDYYRLDLMDMQDIINNCTDPVKSVNAVKSGSLNNQMAIAKIIQAYVYWYATDCWGDIPYSDALMGKTNITYDTQEAVYKGMLKALADAIAMFDDGLAIKGDIVYNGEIAKWKKFANSMRMLMSLRLSKRYPGASDFAATEFKAALADANGSIAINADNFVLAYVGSNFKCPWFNTYDGRKDLAESANMVSVLSGKSDSRQSVYGSSNVGMPYGLNRTRSEKFTSDNPTWAKILPDALRTETSSVVVLSAAEVLLARAEAADRGWTAENAQTLYSSAVTLGFAKWGLTVPGSYDVTLNNPAGTNANLQEIATQEYIASYPNGWFGWSNWRRTGYPVLTPAPDATNDTKQIPRRFVYGDTENNLTPEALKVAVDRLPGGDTQDSKIWWDQ